MIEKRKTQARITFFLLAASVIWMIASRGEVEDKPLDYEEVQVTVVSAKSHRRATGSSRIYRYDVVVEYEGKQYDLINVKSGCGVNRPKKLFKKSTCNYFLYRV